MINLLRKYTIKTKIKIIAFSAMVIIISLLTALILFYQHLNKQENDFHKNQIIIENLSKDFQTKLLNQKQNTLSNEEINKYFKNIKDISSDHGYFDEGTYTQSFLNLLILFLAILLLSFMFFGYLLNQTISRSLGSLKHGMTKFFNYVIHNDQKIDKVDVVYHDEVGEILNYMK